MGQSIGIVLEVSHRNNLFQGCTSYREDGAVEVQQDVNKANNEDVSTSIIEIKILYLIVMQNIHGIYFLILSEVKAGIYF